MKNKELQKLLLNQQEEHTFHKSFDEEFQFYRDVATGNLAVLQGEMLATPTADMGWLSKDSLRNAKYHLIITIAMITRFCVESGLDLEEAYTLSDVYIRKLDLAGTITQLNHIKKEVITEFTKTMHDLPKMQIQSLHIIKSMEYIKSHISESLSVSDVANYTGTTPDHLGRLFQRELNMTISHYILTEKCETAKYLLTNSDQSTTAIALFLNFSSCSHFISRFKKIVGMTPGQYRSHTYHQVLRE